LKKKKEKKKNLVLSNVVVVVVIVVVVDGGTATADGGASAVATSENGEIVCASLCWRDADRSVTANLSLHLSHGTSRVVAVVKGHKAKALREKYLEKN